jgi:hypothetical protein
LAVNGRTNDAGGPVGSLLFAQVHQRPAAGRAPRAKKRTPAAKTDNPQGFLQSDLCHRRPRRRSSRTIAGNRCQGRPFDLRGQTIVDAITWLSEQGF